MVSNTLIIKPSTDNSNSTIRLLFSKDTSRIDPQATFAARGIGLQIIAPVAIVPRNTTLPDPRQIQRAHLRPQSIENTNSSGI